MGSDARGGGGVPAEAAPPAAKRAILPPPCVCPISPASPWTFATHFCCPTGGLVNLDGCPDVQAVAISIGCTRVL